MFIGEVDRNMVFTSLRLGGTLAILTPDRKTFVATLTFVERSGDVVILFFATLHSFQSTGMGWFLLSLLYNKVYTQLKVANSSNSLITFYLKANERLDVFAFYKQRDFKLMSSVSASFPPHLADAFPKEGRQYSQGLSRG